MNANGEGWIVRKYLAKARRMTASGEREAGKGQAVGGLEGSERDRSLDTVDRL
jgi:hypothetical protein